MHFREFPGGPGFRTQCFHGHGQGSIPGWGTQILQTVHRGQKIRKKYINVNFKKELHFKHEKANGLEAEVKEEIHCENNNTRKMHSHINSDERDFKKKRIIIDKWNYFTEKEKWSFSSSPSALLRYIAHCIISTLLFCHRLLELHSRGDEESSLIGKIKTLHCQK